MTLEEIQKWLAMRWLMLGFALVYALHGIGLWLRAGGWVATVLAPSAVGLAGAGLAQAGYIPLVALFVTCVVAPMAVPR